MGRCVARRARRGGLRGVGGEHDGGRVLGGLRQLRFGEIAQQPQRRVEQQAARAAAAANLPTERVQCLDSHRKPLARRRLQRCQPVPQQRRRGRAAQRGAEQIP